MITYRFMTPGDIPAGLALCRAAGWNQLDRDWQQFLQRSPESCVVAVDDGNVVGTVATMRYQHCFSWIGMVLVNAAYRRQGIGMQLLKEALHILQHEQTIKLDATPAGREVYLKLGFTDEYTLSRMTGMGISKSLERSTAQPMTISDLVAVAAFDCNVFGADRQSLLQWMYEGAPHLAFVIEENNNIEGYCFGRQGYNFTHIGPVVANDIRKAKALVTAALNTCPGKPIVLDVTSFDTEWKAWLTTLGFTEQRPLIRMYSGTNQFAGSPQKQFAILGPEFG